MFLAGLHNYLIVLVSPLSAMVDDFDRAIELNMTAEFHLGLLLCGLLGLSLSLNNLSLLSGVILGFKHFFSFFHLALHLN